MDEAAHNPPRDAIFFAEMEAGAPIYVTMPRKTALLIVQKLTGDAAQAGDLVPRIMISPTSIEGNWGGYPDRVLAGYDNADVLMIGIYDHVRPMDIFYPRQGWVENAPIITALLEYPSLELPYVHIGFIRGLLSYGATRTGDVNAIIDGHYASGVSVNEQ